MKNQIPSLVLSFVLSIIVMILFVCSGLSLGIFNSPKLSQTLIQSKYYDSMAKDAAKSVSEYITGRELPLSVLDGVIDEDQMMLDAKGYVESQLNGKGGSISTDSFQIKLAQNILAYLNQSGSIKASELKQGIKEVTSITAAIYRDHLELKAVLYYAQYQRDIAGILKVFLMGSALLSVLLSVVLIKAQKYPHRGMRYIAYSILTATMLQLLATWQMSRHFIIKGTGAYYQVINKFLQESMTSMYMIAGIGIILFAVTLFGIKALKQKGD